MVRAWVRVRVRVRVRVGVRVRVRARVGVGVRVRVSHDLRRLGLSDELECETKLLHVGARAAAGHPDLDHAAPHPVGERHHRARQLLVGRVPGWASGWE